MERRASVKLFEEARYFTDDLGDLCDLILDGAEILV